MIKVLVVDDHPSLGEGTKAIIEQQDDMKADVMTESEKVIDRLTEKKYDVYVVDLFMPKLNGTELAKTILRVDPDAIILIYTGYDIMTYYNMMMAEGVSGFISKTATAEQLITAIRCALREEVVIPLQLLKQLRRVESRPSTDEAQESLSDIILSEREQQILQQVAAGLTNATIALNLNMSQRTIELSLTKVFTKLGVGSRTEAYIKAQEYGLLSAGKIE